MGQGGGKWWEMRSEKWVNHVCLVCSVRTLDFTLGDGKHKSILSRRTG